MKTINLIPLFQTFDENTEFYSPLYSNVKFKKIRKFNPMDEKSPLVIECETLAKNIVLFNNEGKPIIFHPTGEMIFESNLGECMIFPKEYYESKNVWETFIEKILIEE